MHPSIAQRITVLDGLRARAHQATAEFYQKPGVQPPPLAPLIIVRPSGTEPKLKAYLDVRGDSADDAAARLAALDEGARTLIAAAQG